MAESSSLGWPGGDDPAAAPGQSLGWPLQSVEPDVSRETTFVPGGRDTGGLRFAQGDADAGPATAGAPAEAVSRPPPGAPADGSAGLDVSRETPPEPAASGPQPRLTLPLRRPFPRPARTRIITVANQKGGVGKTTTAVNVAASLALGGSRVLVLDLDPQGNASTALSIAHHAGTPSIYDVLIRGMAIEGVTAPVPGIDGLSCVPATIDLAGAEIELVSSVAREARLKRALEGTRGQYDYVFIDCPPSLGLLTVNAFTATDELLIPIQCEYYALEGLGSLMHNIELVRAHLNPGLRLSTMLLTMFDARTRLAEQVAAEVRAHFGEIVLNTVIPRSVRVSEAPSHGQTVMTYDPASRGALAYLAAAAEIADHNLAGVDSDGRAGVLRAEEQR